MTWCCHIEEFGARCRLEPRHTNSEGSLGVELVGAEKEAVGARGFQLLIISFLVFYLHCFSSLSVKGVELSFLFEQL